MPQPFYVRKLELKVGPRKGKTVYFPQAYYYGQISTKQVAAQIAQESALTPAEVFGVLERLAYFCQAHTQLGYKVKIDGLGVFYNELITGKSVKTAEEVTAKLIKCIRPAFTPEYTIINGSFRYAILPEKVELMKIDFNGTTPILSEEEGDTKGDTGGTGSGEGGTGNTGGGSTEDGDNPIG